MKNTSSFLNVQHLNTVLNCSRRGQFVCSSSRGAQSAIFKVPSDINYIPSATAKQQTHSPSLPIAPVPVSV